MLRPCLLRPFSCVELSAVSILRSIDRAQIWASFRVTVLLLLVSACLLVGCVWVGKRRGAATEVGFHPTRCCAPLHGFLLAGLGDGVGDCRGAVVTQDDVLFGSLVVSGRENYVQFFRTSVLGSANCWIYK